MDATSASGWWSCGSCGIDAELPSAETAGCHVPCPECSAPMDELWSWEPAVPATSWVRTAA
ncbi:hypothetical protein [Pseudonocardia asaccharolytica]|uniref:hypothetical protein n=1 Tax=Pseudonocardia asaccharolytica TaxID=54010 RepID=UPI0011BE3424|nr:hypothetical protein [Pseudonocardia asaccharolytica]